MKKSLLALAAMGAFAGAAQAQSSVTVYGILDVGYVGGNERAAPATGNVAKQTWSTIGASAESTSRLGFRGNEDLGGGTRAFFTLETEITPQNGTYTNNRTRAAFVGLGQKGMGQVAIGTQNTVITDAMSPTITGQFNNMTGSMLFATRTGGATTNGGSTAFASSSSINGNTDAFTFRAGNTIKVTSDRFAGFQANAMYLLNSTNTTNTGATGTGENNQSGWGLGLNYQWQKLIVTGAYMSLKAVQNNSTTVTPFTQAGLGTTYSATGTNGGSNVQDNQAYVGATYDFGILKAYAGWLSRKVTSQVNTNQYAQRTAQEIGVRGNLTKTIEGWASVGNGRFTAYGAGEPTANINGFQLGSNYWLSKRTNLYAMYGQSATSNSSRIAGGSPVSFNTNNYAVGVRHTF